MVSNHYQRAGGKSLRDWQLPPGTIHPKRLEAVLSEVRLHPSELAEDVLFTFLPALAEMDQQQLDKIREDGRLKSVMKIIADCTTVHSAATALAQNEPWDLAAIYYDAIDHFGHGFMRYHPPRLDWVDEADFAIWKDVVESGYRYHDMMLGTLMHLAGEETTLILVSDHGFHPDHMRPREIPHEPAGPAHEHRHLGVLAARGPGLRKDALIHGATLLDICPTVLHCFGLPTGEDMDGKVLLELWESPRQPSTVPSWDAIDGDHGQHPPERQIAAAESKAALDQLVALGYIEKPDEDRHKALEQTVRELDYNLACAYIDGGIFTEAILLLERLYEQWPLRRHEEPALRRGSGAPSLQRHRAPHGAGAQRLAGGLSPLAARYPSRSAGAGATHAPGCQRHSILALYSVLYSMTMIGFIGFAGGRSGAEPLRASVDRDLAACAGVPAQRLTLFEGYQCTRLIQTIQHP